jgi:ABC-type uncharacterized transport system involved in gliding motility auxiliary subunit
MQKKSLETFLYSVGGVIAMALILVAVNVITSSLRTRVDLTKEKAYTLSEGTRAILAKLDTPVKIRFYCSQSASASPQTVFLKTYARKVEDLLAEYKQVGKGKIIIEKYDPQPDSDAEDSAKLDGVTGAQMPSGDMFYLGIAVSLLDSKEAIPFCQPNRERLLEYDLSRAITRVVTPEKPVVGVMSPLPVFGAPMNPMMMQMGQRGQPAWAVITELQKDFTVQNVAMTADKIDDNIKVLVVIHPKDITDAAQFAIDQFVLRGGKLIAFLDANSLVDNQNQRNPMMGQMGGGGSSLDKLLKTWGVTFENSKVVADRNFQMVLGGGDSAQAQRPTWLSITPEGLDTNDIITSQIDNVWYFAGGAFSGTPADGLKQSILLKSTTDSGLVEGFLANLSPEAAMKDFKPTGKEQALAVRLTGKFKTAFPAGKPGETAAPEPQAGETNAPAKPADDSLKEAKADSTVILIGDADMIYDNFTIQDTPTPFGNMRRQLNANLNFAQNAVEQLAGDNNLIAVRSRATLNRPFEVVRKKEAEASQKFQGVVDELQKKAEAAQQRIGELQAQKSDQNQRFIISPEQQAELVKLEKESVETDKKLRAVKKDLAREVDSLKTSLTWWNIFAMPAAVTFGGIFLAVYKRKLTAAK